MNRRNARFPALLTAALIALVSCLMSPAPQASAATRAASASAERGAPAACKQSDYLWSHLARCGRAGSGNTGPRMKACPGGLKPMGSAITDQITVSKDGASITCKQITGCLTIDATGVLIKHVRISCSSGSTGEEANGTGVIKVLGGAEVKIARTDIDGQRAVHSCIWHEGARMVAVRVDCRGVNDGIFAWSEPGGDNFTIRRSYFHDLTTATANGHVDGFQTEGAANGRIVGNTYLMTTDNDDEATSAIAIWNSFRDSRNIVVADNLIAGGGFAVYAEDYSPSEDAPEGAYVTENISFSDNAFSQRLFGCVGVFGVWFRVGPTDGWQRSGNYVLETGESVDGGNPRFQGRECT